jgi:hypothetical protein
LDAHRNIPHRYACHPSPSEGCGRKSQQSPEALPRNRTQSPAEILPEFA